MAKIVAVTGVNSYFASTILPKLQNDPEVDCIIGIDVTPWRGGFDKVRFYREDIRSERMSSLLKGVDAVFHLAFVVGEIRDKEKTFDININGSKNVFSACAQNKVKKVVYTSSMTVYGAHKNNPIGFTEESPLVKNEDNYYNSSKVDVENFVTGFFRDHPEMTLTVIRAGLLCGPRINNMFSKLWGMKVTSLPMGRESYNQFIHEEDLGEALYLAYKKDLPGIYNVTADDAVATRWCFKKAGAVVIPLPTPVLRLAANLAFMLGLFPAGGRAFPNTPSSGFPTNSRRPAAGSPGTAPKKPF
jgi:UDP-glucose 4-epimerase